MAIKKQFCTFYLDKYCFGVNVLEVQEVFRYQEMTRVPLAPGDISGLINLRGQIITAITLRLRLGMQAQPAGRVPMNVVVRTQNEVVSLWVDQIGDVVEVSEDFYEKAPETIRGAMGELITGVYKLKDRLLLILDTEKIVQFESIAAQ
ncbi:MAG: chemotaxis protein CheW [Nitrospinota bacterium]|nr:chemotaxis protein CheW [Nitrospinota bacterium]